MVPGIVHVPVARQGATARQWRSCVVVIHVLLNEGFAGWGWNWVDWLPGDYFVVLFFVLVEDGVQRRSRFHRSASGLMRSAGSVCRV